MYSSSICLPTYLSRIVSVLPKTSAMHGTCIHRYLDISTDHRNIVWYKLKFRMHTRRLDCSFILALWMFDICMSVFNSFCHIDRYVISFHLGNIIFSNLFQNVLIINGCQIVVLSIVSSIIFIKYCFQLPCGIVNTMLFLS